MKFFIDKEKAHHNSRLFLTLFAINVVIISALNAALTFVFLTRIGDRLAPTTKLFLAPFFISIFVFVIATMIAQRRLRDGSAVAQLLGGRLLQFPLNDEKERRLFNIVEEMSIASGVPIPFVFVLDQEETINAFAAGADPKNAAIAVSRGALEALTRDELQAVVGHEFSHILNDDMELNTQVGGAVNGFMFFMKLGEVLLRGNRRQSYTGSRKSKGGGSSGPLIIFALGLYILGGMGFILGRYMQGLISQQREYLADASSSQFTRNPEALARALAKIYNGKGSRLSQSDKYELAHIFFADSLEGKASLFFKTHPPLLERIAKLLPAGHAIENFMNQAAVKANKQDSERVIKEAHRQKLNHLISENSEQLDKIKIHASAIGTLAIEAMRIPTEEHFQKSKEVLDNIPTELHKRLLDPENARAHLLAVVISISDDPQSLLKTIAESFPDQKLSTEDCLDFISLNPRNRLLVFQLSLGALRALPIEEKSALWSLLFNAFQSDKNLCLTEALLLFIARDQLMPQKSKAPKLQKPGAYHAAALARLGYWLNNQNLSDEKTLQIRNEIEKTYLLPVPRIPTQNLTWLLFEESLSRLSRLEIETRTQSANMMLKFLPENPSPGQMENFRLLSLCLGIPIPLNLENPVV